MVAAVAIGSPRATQASVIACIVILLLYEPVSIAVAGGTIGHLSLNLRIVRASDLGRVSFGRALVRTVVKGLIGLPVFLAVYVTRKCQGVHDLVRRHGGDSTRSRRQCPLAGSRRRRLAGGSCPRRRAASLASEGHRMLPL